MLFGFLFSSQTNCLTSVIPACHVRILSFICTVSFICASSDEGHKGQTELPLLFPSQGSLSPVQRWDLSAEMLLPEDCEGMANVKPSPELKSLGRFMFLYSGQSHLLCSCLSRCLCLVFWLWMSMAHWHSKSKFIDSLSWSQVFIPYKCILLVLFCLQLYENVNEQISNCFKAGCRTVKNRDKSCNVKTCRQVCHLAPSVSHWPPA